MTLHLQKYLREGGTPESLKTSFGIDHKRHGTYENLILFKYSMIDSPMHNPIVQECRGIILDQDDNWNIVNYSLHKFFNFGEPNAEEIDWKTALCQEKVDGSLISRYFYRGEWFVSTTGTPDAQTEINGCGITFSKLFWDALTKCNDGRTFEQVARDDNEAQRYNFWFELTSVYNRVVVDHKETKLTLLGARRVDTWEEVHPSTVSHLLPNVSVVKEYPLQAIEDVYAVLDKMNPLEQEGFVIVWDKPDGSKGRVKCKCDGYVILHHAKDALVASIKNMINVVRKGEAAEYLSAFPELQARMDQVRLRYLELVTNIQECYIAYANIPIQKDFALTITKTGVCKCTGALFSLRSGKVKSIKEYISTMNIKSLKALLGY